MQLCKRSVLLLLLFSWLSILVSARAIPSASQEDCAEDNCPVISQGSSLVREGGQGQESNFTHLSRSINALSNIPSTIRRETVVEVGKRKSPSSPNTNSPNTNLGSPDPNNGSNNGDGTNTGGGLDLNNPGGNDPSPAPKDPGAGLDLNSPIDNNPNPAPKDPGAGLDLNSPVNNDPSPAPKDPGAGIDPSATAPAPDPSPTPTPDPSAVTENPSPATLDPSVTKPDPTTAGSSVPSTSAVASSLATSASESVSTTESASSPAVAPTGTPGQPSATPSPTSSPDFEAITDEEAAARFCPSSPGDLRLRGLCQSKGPAGDDGSDSEPPARVVPNPNAPPANPPAAAPPLPSIDRRTVTNWFDVVQMNPKPRFAAREALDNRIAGNGQDRPIADLTGKYHADETDLGVNTLNQDSMGSISTMWTTLGRTPPGRSTKLYITPESNHGQEIHDAVFANDGSFIGAISSYRNKDPLRDSDDRIEWSELMFNRLSSISGGNVGALSAVARSSIVTDGATHATIKTALQRTRQTTTRPNQIATFNANATPGSDEAIAFEALSRSDNVNGVLHLLGDHYTALGNKNVLAIKVASNQRGSKQTTEPSFNMIIDIG